MTVFEFRETILFILLTNLHFIFPIDFQFNKNVKILYKIELEII